MGKKNHNHSRHQEMRQLIRDQQKEIVHLRRVNDGLRQHANSMHNDSQERFISLMSCVYAHCVDGIITEEQAGSLLLSLVGVWHHA